MKLLRWRRRVRKKASFHVIHLKIFIAFACFLRPDSWWNAKLLPLILFTFLSSVTRGALEETTKAHKGSSGGRQIGCRICSTNNISLQKKYLSSSSSKEIQLNNLRRKFVIFWWSGEESTKKEQTIDGEVCWQMKIEEINPALWYCYSICKFSHA